MLAALLSLSTSEELWKEKGGRGALKGVLCPPPSSTPLRSPKISTLTRIWVTDSGGPFGIMWSGARGRAALRVVAIFGIWHARAMQMARLEWAVLFFLFV